jgi:transposase-like protein
MRTPELLSDPVYHDEEAARLYLQEVRWPDGVFCPFCGALDDIKPLGGPSMGPGWFYCPHCQDKFTVRVGSLMERSHIALTKWLLAFRLMASSKKGVSAHQLHRTLGISYKSAWFLGHRIREAMTDDDPRPLGGEGKIIEADETYIGRVGDPKDTVFVNGKGWVRRAGDEKMKVMTLVERGGKARSVHIDRATSVELNRVLVAKADPQSRLMTTMRKPTGALAAASPATIRCQPHRRRVRAQAAGRHQGAYEHGRGLLFDLQARHEGHLSALHRQAPSPLPRGIRFPL